MAESEMTTASFRRVVWAHYKKMGRHDLPWRQTHDVYNILVSEIMLQQTQVERVIPFYTKFIKQFGSAKKLAAAPLSDVLKAWQGLGYNRRAKMLHSAAKELAKTRFDLTSESSRSNLVSQLESLSGVGPYTARAVAAFACNADVIVIETNIRTAIIHHFFSKKKKVSDKEIEKVLKRAAPDVALAKSGEWYSALMDYGAHLKRSGISHNAKSKTYAKQSTFAGSLRQARGAILREYTKGITSRARLVSLLGPSRKAQMKQALEALTREELVSGNLVSEASSRRRRGA
ncbi:MAG: A/G-specific adenine glycosylase [Candidatus Pacebacteria bacterium]|nr:A/G-specific adenine glycosylase [Candidatus Paceibacterota bacterium]